MSEYKMYYIWLTPAWWKICKKAGYLKGNRAAKRGIRYVKCKKIGKLSIWWETLKEKFRDKVQEKTKTRIQ